MIQEETLYEPLLEELKLLLKRNWGMVTHPKALIASGEGGESVEVDIVLGESEDEPTNAFHVKKGSFNEDEVLWKIALTIRGIYYVWAVLEEGSWSKTFEEILQTHVGSAGIISYTILNEEPVKLHLRVVRHAARANAGLYEETKKAIRSLGINEFTGFTLEHFEYVIDYHNEFKKSLLKRSMKLFAEQVADELDKRLGRRLEHGVGQDVYWCWFCDKTYGEMAHFGVILDSEGLGVWVNMEHVKTVGRFRTNLEMDPRGFLAILKKVKKEKGSHVVEVMERIERRLRHWEEFAICRLSLDHFGEEELEFIRSQLGKIKYSRVYVMRAFAPDMVVREGKGIVFRAVDEMENLKEVYDFANK